MKEALGWILGILIVIALFIGLSFGMGWMGNKQLELFGKEKANIERDIFENNKSYVKGMSADLADYQYQLTLTEDKIERKAIIRLIINKYGDFDETKLENRNLEQFLVDIRKGEIK